MSDSRMNAADWRLKVELHTKEARRLRRGAVIEAVIAPLHALMAAPAAIWAVIRFGYGDTLVGTLCLIAAGMFCWSAASGWRERGKYLTKARTVDDAATYAGTQLVSAEAWEAGQASQGRQLS